MFHDFPLIATSGYNNNGGMIRLRRGHPKSLAGTAPCVRPVIAYKPRRRIHPSSPSAEPNSQKVESYRELFRMISRKTIRKAMMSYIKLVLQFICKV